MTQEGKELLFQLLSVSPEMFPLLPEDFRGWGISTYRGARAFMKEFAAWELARGRAWIIEEKPCKREGKESEGESIAFFGRINEERLDS